MKRKIILTIISLILSACVLIRPGDFHHFAEPEPETYVRLLPIVQEYFYYRKQAVLSGDLDSFYQRYPKLSEGADLERGINIEAHLVESFYALQPIDGNIHPEYYEKIKIKDLHADLQILVHGMELYLWQDPVGAFNESGGEFKLVLFLQHKGDTWQIVQTDEVTLAEWKSFRP
jgi:hypothetical protein